MAKKGENIYKRKDGRYEARYIKGHDDKNKIIYGYVYGKTYTDAKNRKRNALINLKQDNSKLPKDSMESKINSWLSQKQITIKESTYTKYYSIIQKHILPYFKEYKIYQITDEVISKFIISKIEENLSPKTIKDIGVLLNQILRYMNIKDITITTPKVPKREIKILNSNDRKTLVSYIKENPNFDTFGIALALLMGLRIGEVCALKIKYIDLENHYIFVRHTVERVKDFKSTTRKTKLILEIPKTDSSIRAIHIPNDIYGFVKEMVEKYTDNENFVVTNKQKLVDPRSYYYRYKKIINGLGFGDYKFHTLRHTFATDCVAVGCDAKTLSELLGHSDIKISLSVYVHPTEKLKISYMDKISF